MLTHRMYAAAVVGKCAAIRAMRDGAGETGLVRRIITRTSWSINQFSVFFLYTFLGKKIFWSLAC
jgi:hypothetical protein